MVKFDTEKIESEAKRDFERAWLESGKLLDREGIFHRQIKKTKRHPLMELVVEIRNILLDMGFTEVVLPMIVDSSEVVRQYGPEAPVILDRVFFLAGLERPDIGMGKKKLELIKKIAPEFEEVESLKNILRRYKRGEISADDLVEALVEELRITETQAGKIIHEVFPRFKEMKPIPSNLSLRSHTTSLWFPTITEFLKREPLPIQLFSIGPKFRREQKLDQTHLYESWTASLVVMDENVSLEDGKRVTREVFSRLGFPRVELVTKKTTSKYYAPRTEFEVFLKSGEKNVEVADGGLYSPVALSRYKIPYPVFNLGVGLERLLMARTGEADIRRLVYPYFYTKVEFSDQELAKMIRVKETPRTEVGREIARAISATARKYADTPSPCEFEAYRGRVTNRTVVVKLIEPESGTKLIGPAGFNSVYVYKGNIVGVPPKGWEEDVFLNEVKRYGTPTGITYMDGVAALAASEIERSAKKDGRIKVRIRNVKSPADVNLMIEDVAYRYLTSNKKRIDIRGPVFTTITAEFI